MHILGFPIGEIAALLTVVGVISGGVMWLFKLAIITPLSVDIKALNGNIKILTDSLDETKAAHKTLNEKLEQLELDVATKFAKNDEFSSSVKRRLEFLENKERSARDEKFF